MWPVTAKRDLFKAYAVLFGPGDEITADVVRFLQPSELKARYRKKALDTHPDRAGALGESEAEMSERFIEATNAYETLRAAIKGASASPSGTGIQAKHEGPAGMQNRTGGCSDHFYFGPMPKFKLLIGQYLYYSGRISWKALIDAISWQKRQRPLVGQIAVSWGILAPHDIGRILQERRIERRYRERFCRYALRSGYITPFERMALLGKQRKLQPPIGEYFVSRRILCSEEIEKNLAKQSRHNRLAF